jgi:hypothetical protein
VSCSICSFVVTCWIPRVVLHFFICYYIPNPKCPVPSVHSLLRAESHVSCSTSSFVITIRIPRVLLLLFIRYFMLNSTCLSPFLHLLLRSKSHVSCSVCSLLTKYHVSGCSSLLIPSSRTLKKMFAQPPCCHFKIYEVFTLTKICHFSILCYPASL